MKAFYILLTFILLCSCTDEEKFTGQEENISTVERTFDVTVSPMQEADGSVATRSDKTASETKISKLNFVQFDGTSDDNTVCQQGVATLNGGKVILPLLSVNGSNRVYLLANNPLPVVKNGITTLGEFKKMGAKVTPMMGPGNGLPMSAFADFNPMDPSSSPAFNLQTMVAKVTVSFHIAPEAVSLFLPNNRVAVYLRQTANAITLGTFSVSDAAQRPTGVTYTAETYVGQADLYATYGTFTYYVPENLAGRNSSIRKITERSLTKAQPNATRIDLTGKIANGSAYTFSLFVGDPSDVTDFNLVRNHAYTLVANIMGLSTQDERLKY